MLLAEAWSFTLGARVLAALETAVVGLAALDRHDDLASGFRVLLVKFFVPVRCFCNLRALDESNMITCLAEKKTLYVLGVLDDTIRFYTGHANSELCSLA